MAKIFISYRREDTGGYAGRLFDRLSEYFGAGQVFMDITGIEPGADFVEAIRNRVIECDVLIAVVGREWLSVKAPDGRARLDDPNDYVRLEIASALREGVRVIPALVGGAALPRENELPENLCALATLNFWQGNEHDFGAGVQRLIETLERAVAQAGAERRVRRSAKTSLRRPESEISELRRWVLYYVPSGPLTWALHALFFMVLGVTVFVLITMSWVTAMEKMGGVSAWLTIGTPVGVFLLILLLIRAAIFVYEPDTSTHGLRRWLLLYAPRRKGVALLHLFFFLNLALLPFVVTSVLMGMSMVQPYRVVLPFGIGALAVYLLLILVVREIAAGMDPLRDPAAPRSWFSRLFYLWRPRTPLAWLPRLIFYAALAPLFFVPAWLLNGDFSVSIRMGVPCVLLIVAARGWSKALQRRPGDLRAYAIHAARTLLMPPLRSGTTVWMPWLLYVAAALVALAVALWESAALQYLGMSPAASVVYVSGVFAVIAVCAAAWASLAPARVR